jgi:hypothetical protein
MGMEKFFPKTYAYLRDVYREEMQVRRGHDSKSEMMKDLWEGILEDYGSWRDWFRETKEDLR